MNFLDSVEKYKDTDGVLPDSTLYEAHDILLYAIQGLYKHCCILTINAYANGQLE
jgi:hypothetical protein